MLQPSASNRSSTRASDIDRADACAILDNAYADGELDAEEHQQRCSSAMSAKTIGQLFSLISDLQTPPPELTQQPTTAVTVNPNRKRIRWGIVLGSIVAAVAIPVLVDAWNSGSSPSPIAPGPAPHKSSGSSRTFLSVTEVVSTVSGDFQDDIGHPPERVSCPGDLAGRVGAFERCSIVDNGERYNADVTVTAVNRGRITTNDTIGQVNPPAPSRP